MSRKSISNTSEVDTPISESDIEAGRLVLRQRVGGRVVQPKRRVTLYLDTAVVEHFKGMAGERGYQTLINETLRKSLLQADVEAIRDIQQSDMLAALRKVIREELKGRRAA